MPLLSLSPQSFENIVWSMVCRLWRKFGGTVNHKHVGPAEWGDNRKGRKVVFSKRGKRASEVE